METFDKNPVLRSIAGPPFWGLRPWEAMTAAGVGLGAGALVSPAPLAFMGAAGLVLVLLVLWRRQDHDRADYVWAWWRTHWGARAYALIGRDDAYAPLPRPPGPYTAGLPRVQGARVASPAPRGWAKAKVAAGLAPSPLSAQVPLWDILQDSHGDGLWVTPSGDVVIGYDVTGLHLVYADAPVVLEACRRLYYGAAKLPDHWTAQFILRASPPAPEALDAFCALRASADPIAQTQAKVRAAYLQAKRPRRFRVRLYVSRTPTAAKPFRATPDPTQATDAAKAAESWLHSAGLTLRRLTPDEMWADMARYVASDPEKAITPSVAKDEAPRAALMQAPVTWTPDVVKIGRRFIKVLTLARIEGTTAFTDIESLFLQDLPFDFDLVAYVRTPERVRTRLGLELSSRVAYATASGSTVPSGLAQTRFQEIRTALEADQAGDQRVMDFGLQVAVWGRSAAEVHDRAEQLQRRLQQRSYTLLEETGRHDAQYLTAMAPGGLRHFDRWIRLLSNNVVDLLPLFDSRRGDTVPACLLETDRGELWAYDPAAAHRVNWNAFVVGASGSGKSVMVNHLIANACLASSATQGRVLVVDFAGPEKSSYLMLAGVYGGRFLPVIADDTGLNPFPARQDGLDETGALEGHTESFLTVLVDLLVENQDRSKDTKLYRNLIQAALRALYQGRRPPCFASFLDVLADEQTRTPDDRRENLIRLLRGTLAGPGGRLFLSEERLIADEPFVIFDLFGIEAYAPEIREAIVFTVCESVRRLAFSTLAGDEKKKYIFLDEVAQLVRQPGVVSLIQELYATARKHGTAVTTVTQKYSDFVGSGLAETVRSNSTTGLFLSHAADAASRALIASDMSFNGRERHLFETLHVKKGTYSELLLRADDGADGITTAKLRLGLPPFEYELYTSDVEDRRRQQRIRERFPRASTLEVIERAARRGS